MFEVSKLLTSRSMSIPEHRPLRLSSLTASRSLRISRSMSKKDSKAGTESSDEDISDDELENFFLNEIDHCQDCQSYSSPRRMSFKTQRSEYEKTKRMPMFKKKKTVGGILKELFPPVEENTNAVKDFETRMRLQKMSENRKTGRGVFNNTDLKVVKSMDSATSLIQTTMRALSGGSVSPISATGFVRGNSLNTLRTHHTTLFIPKDGKWYDVDYEEHFEFDSPKGYIHTRHDSEASHGAEQFDDGESRTMWTHRLTPRQEADDTQSWWVRWYNKLWYWWENNSTSLTLQRVYERCLFMSDLFSDVQVLRTLINAREPVWAMISWSSLAAPYVACWTAGLTIVYDKADSYYLNKTVTEVFKAIYVFPLFGIPLLLLFDFVLVILWVVINPILLLFKFPIFGVNRDLSNYLALREITGLFLTNVMQVCLQIYIFLNQRQGVLELEDTEIAMAVTTSIVSIIYMFWKLKKEAYMYGEGLFDYTLLTLQGRFNFMPYVRNIASGALTEVIYAEDESGNTGNYLRFDEKQLRTLFGSVNSNKCDLSTLILGKTCENINVEQTDVLWQLMNLCALRYIEFDEGMTQEEILKNRDKILRMACEKEYAGIVSKLLYLKPVVNINSCDHSNGMTPLMYACKAGSFAITRRLLDFQLTKKQGLGLVNLNLRCSKKRTAIMYCLSCHKLNSNRVIDIDMDVLKLLLSYPRETKEMNLMLNYQDYEGRTIISYLAERGGQHAREALRLLFAEDEKLLELDVELAKSCEEPLNYTRINISISDNRKMTPLMYACQKGNIKTVKMLLRHKSKGGKYSITQYQTDCLGRQALHYAVLENQDNVVKYLLSRRGKRRPDVNHETSRKDGQTTPLMYSVIWEHTSIMKVLLSQKGIDINARDVNERTALIRGTRSGSAKGVRYLLNNASNLDIFAKDKFDRGAWHYAATTEMRAVLAYNTRNMKFKKSLQLCPGEDTTYEHLQERVMIHTNIRDEFTIAMLLAAFNNNPELVNAAYDKVGGYNGDLDKLRKVVLERLDHWPQDSYLKTSQLDARPLNSTHIGKKQSKMLGKKLSSFDVPKNPTFRQQTIAAWL